MRRFFAVSVFFAVLWTVAAAGARADIIQRTLSVGSYGADVSALQKFLIGKASGPATEALAQSGASGYFGQITKEAVIEFQKSAGIEPPNGLVGPLTRGYINGGSGAAADNSGAVAVPASGAGYFEGIVTQFNLGDGSFTLRERDGTLLNVQNPFVVGAFVRLQGNLNNGVLSNVPQIQILDSSKVPPIPAITVASPGTGEVGTQITVSGSGFTRTGNTIAIGSVKNAVTNITSADGSTLVFNFPPAPCDQTLKKSSCPTTVIAPGLYDLTVSNKNGISNSVSFQVLPLPNLGITTDLLPQAVTGAYYDQDIAGLGGAERYTWQVSGELPPGMYFVQTACTELPCKSPARVYGSPRTAGTYNFTVTLTSGSETISRQFLITVVQALSQGY